MGLLILGLAGLALFLISIAMQLNSMLKNQNNIAYQIEIIKGQIDLLRQNIGGGVE